MATDKEAVVVIDRLTKKYGDFTALDGLSLRLGRGLILGLIGLAIFPWGGIVLALIGLVIIVAFLLGFGRRAARP